MTVSPLIAPVAQRAADWLRSQLPLHARLACDSRMIGTGDVFVACPGERSDGRGYIERAVGAGAAAIVLEEVGAEAFESVLDTLPVPQLRVKELRHHAGEMAAAYLDQPSARMTVVAVTGTNGKTSCTHWIAQGCNARALAARGETAVGRADAPAVVIGTLGAGVPGALRHAEGHWSLTTPDAVELQQQFSSFAAEGVELVALEASSIGLQQGRLNGTRIGIAVLTNLTRDHLDYHVTMQAYAAAKAMLFSWPTLQAVVVNLEDPASTGMLDAADPELRRIGYLISDASVTGAERLEEAGERSATCSELLTATATDEQGRVVLSHFRQPAGSEGLTGGVDSVDLRLSLIGRFNLSNALAVAGVWLALGWSLAEVAAQLERLLPVAGRLEVVGDLTDSTRPLVVVDYAHTPDALVNALQALRPLADSRGGRLWCVFGAGGNRDAGKRAPMAAAAERHADRIVLTSDNPRDEAPDSIIAQLRDGLSREPHGVDADRALAIRATLLAAAPSDVVLIAGKGHETYQEIGGRRLPFSDVEQAALALQARTAGDSNERDDEPSDDGAQDDV